MQRVELESVPLDALIKTDVRTGLRILPYWLAQPYFRPLPEQKATLLANTSVELLSVSNATNLASTSTSTNTDQDVEATAVPLPLTI